MVRSHRTMAALISTLVVLLGCSGLVPLKKGYIVFIDYTRSALTFAADNPEKINELLQSIISDFDPDDLLEVYPIHAYTESATPLLRLNGPELKGDLRDIQRREDWKNETAQQGIGKVLKTYFNADRMLSTNIYSTVRKINGLLNRGYDVEAYVICDMIQDFNGEDFSVMFGKGGSVDPAAYARRKVAEFGFESILTDVEVHILIPGSPHGIQAYDSIRAGVNTFWNEFFSGCGAKVVVEDL